MAESTTFGPALRQWRTRRRLSQADLADRARVSARHLSWLETGRSSPSRDMVLRLATHLDVPLRQRNDLLLRAGLAPEVTQRSLDDPTMAAVESAVTTLLDAHLPCPALAIDGVGDLVVANDAVGLFLDLVDPGLLASVRPNVHRLTLHPEGLAPHVVNFADLAAVLVRQIRRDLEARPDPALAGLLDEVLAYPDVRAAIGRVGSSEGAGVVVPMRLRHPRGTLSLFTTITTFGTPADVTVAELALETFFPADQHTREFLDQRARPADPSG